MQNTGTKTNRTTTDEKAKYMRVSDLVGLADEVGYDRKHMVTLLATLHGVTDYRRCYQQLSMVGNLDYVFDLANYMKHLFESPEFVEIIVEAFKEATNSLQFFVALKLYKYYGFLLEVNQIEFTPFLIQQVVENPYFIEAKLQLI